MRDTLADVISYALLSEAYGLINRVDAFEDLFQKDGRPSRLLSFLRFRNRANNNIA